MREVTADLWLVDCDVVCITTNGTVKSDGCNIMGGGCAREAVERYEHLPYLYGDLIKRFGHHVYWLSGYDLVMFPTKDTISSPSTLTRILLSIKELTTLANLYEWEHIALPRPGCGLGGLDWETEVKPALSFLDDRFILVGYPE